MGAMHGRETPKRADARCTGCGRRGQPLVTFECTWPDGRASVERYCTECHRVWQRQLIELGVTFQQSDCAPGLAPATVEGIRAIADHHQEMANRWRRLLGIMTEGARN
jgi:hypothetical protein